MRWRLPTWILAAVLIGATAFADELPEEDPLNRLPHGPLGVIGIGWDEGIVYGLEWPVKARARMYAKLDVDGGWVGGDAGTGWDGEVRRFRFSTAGQLYHWLGPAFKFEFDVEGSEVFINDFYLRWDVGNRFFQRLQAGYFEPATSLQSMASSSGRPLMELASPVAAFAPGFRTSGQVEGVIDDPDISWQLSLSSVGQSRQNEGDASDAPLRVIGRAVWRPWDREAGDELLHLGISTGVTISAGGNVQYRARPESFLVDFVIDTGDIDSNAVLVSGEAAWRRGPLTLQGEVFRSFVDDRNAQLGGIYVEASRVLTDEVRPYHRGLGIFGRVVPRREFNPLRGKWVGGAIQSTFRVSWIDLDSGDIRGGRMLTTNLGAVWTWNRYVRIHWGWVYARVDRDGRTEGSNILQTRMELRF